MANGKYAAEGSAKRVNSKLIALLLALVMLFGGVIGGTVAWLIDSPAPLTNTFTYGDINITLTETDTNDGDGDANTNEYKMIPGQIIQKDPVITVKKGSEDMWLFVKLEESENFGTFMEYTKAEGWTALPGVDGVYYRHIPAADVADDDMEIHVIANDTVTVKESVKKEMLNALTSYPTLTVTAYAVQYAGNPTHADAWARIQ